MTKIQRAILSVTDKTGIVEFGQALRSMGVEILSTGGTATKLREGKVKVVDVSKFTGTPEMFGGRVKTLHPKIHGGILYRRDNKEDVNEARKNKIKPIDLVAVNLYKFEEKAAKPGVTLEELVEEVDIGGPTMLMSAFKNHKDVIVASSPETYAGIIKELRETGDVSMNSRRVLAAYAINLVADYRAANAVTLTPMLTGEQTLRLTGRQGKQLGRYGENWDQKAWVFYLPGVKEPNVVTAKQLHGGPLGYNNYLDADAALATVMEFDKPTAVVIKHNNPCGIATADNLAEALELAWQGDTVSAFGSIIAFNREVDLETVKVLTDRYGGTKDDRPTKGYFVEVLVAPSYTEEALAYIKEKKTKDSLRILAVGDLKKPQESFDYRVIRGGVLRQTRNSKDYLTSLDDCFATKHTIHDDNSDADRTIGMVTEHPMKGLYDFAWKAVKRVKSNGIAIAREYAPGQYQLLGIGAGQMNRRDSTELAIKNAEKSLELEFLVAGGHGDYIQAGFFTRSMEHIKKLGIVHPESDEEYKKAVAAYKKEVLSKCVAASDAFFPFPDGPELLLKAGIRNIIQPGGGNKDKEIINLVNKYGGTMVFTGKRNFLH